MMMMAVLFNWGIEDIFRWVLGLLGSLGALSGIQAAIVIVVVGLLLYQVFGKR